MAPRLEIAWSHLGLVAAVGSSLAVRFMPEYAVWQSYIATFLLYFTLVTALTFVYNTFLYPFLLSPYTHIPEPKGGSFLIGHWKEIFLSPTGHPQQAWMKDIPNNGLIRFRVIFNRERLMPTTPQALSEVLVQKSYDFVKPAWVRAGLGRILGFGLVLTEGDVHKRQRKNLNPAFSYRHIKDIYPMFWAKGCEMTERLSAHLEAASKSGESNVVEVTSWSSRATLDIIGAAGMGKDFGSLENPNSELNLIYKGVVAPNRAGQILAVMNIFLPSWLVRSIPIAQNNKIEHASSRIRDVARTLIRDKQAKMEAEAKRSDKDILSVALESGVFKEDELIDQLMTFLIAGHETTATSITWAIYLLCQNPSYQTRLRAEIRANLPSITSLDDPAGQVPLDAKIFDTHLPLLHSICNECLRLYAPVPITVRESACNTSIAGQPIDKGTTILIPTHAINTSTELWGPDAATFNPERWMTPAEDPTQPSKIGNGGAKSNFAYMTFLHGPRSCIGAGFAKAEFALLLACLVGRFSFTLEHPDRVVQIKGGITAKPKGGLPCFVTTVPGW